MSRVKGKVIKLKKIFSLICALLIVPICASCHLQPEKKTESSVSAPNQAVSSKVTNNGNTSKITSIAAPRKEGQTVVETKGNVLSVWPGNVKVCGRYHLENLELAFCNTYAGIEFAFKGSALSVEFAASSYTAGSEIYAKVYVDDRDPIDIKISKAGYYSIVTGLDASVIHNVKIAKRTESNVGRMFIRNMKINSGGEFYTAKENITGRKILVLGDSIACGYGNIYVDGDYSKGVTAYEDGCQTFATMLAEKYKAELEVVCISGIGTASIKDKLYPLLPVFLNEDNTSSIPYDFTSYVPDVVVIELGTNDDALQADNKLLSDAVKEMIQTVRLKYPKASIIWTYGIMSQDHMKDIQTAVEGLIKAGDKNLQFLPLEITTRDETPTGLHSHPSLKGHRRMANVLSEVVEKMIGWM